MTDEELSRAFWSIELPSSEWTHNAHLRMAWLTLEEKSIDEAHLLMRVGIIKLNAFHGLVETPQRGYHETITRVWLILVAALKSVARGRDSRDFLELHPGGLTREVPLRHYSKERLFSLPARSHSSLPGFAFGDVMPCMTETMRFSHDSLFENRARAILALALLVACKRKEAPPPPIPPPPTSASVGIGPPLPPAPWKNNFDPVPVGTEPLRLVAVGKDSNTKILSLALHGETMWLSTNGSDALASGAGALEKAKDPLAGLPYEPGVHDLKVVGFYPNLFVLRTQKKGLAQAAVFILRDGHWRQADALPPSRKPIAFLAYRTGAIAVTGIHDPTQNPDSYFSSKERGTVLTNIDGDGHVSTMPEPQNERFIAWNGAWDARGISLIGAIAEETDLSYGPHWVPVGTHIWQLSNDGKTVTTKIQGKKAYHSIVPGFALYRNNGFTTSEPDRFYIEEDNESWRPNGATTFRIDASGGTMLRSIQSNHFNFLSRSRFVGENLYTIQGYRPTTKQSDPVTMQLLRVGPNGKTEMILLQPVASDGGAPVACEPTEIIAGAGEELWIQAECECHGEWWFGKCPGTFPAVFRRGGPEQTPIAF